MWKGSWPCTQLVEMVRFLVWKPLELNLPECSRGQADVDLDSITDVAEAGQNAVSVGEGWGGGKGMTIKGEPTRGFGGWTLQQLSGFYWY